MNLLRSAATKRDAKAYLSRLKSPQRAKAPSSPNQDAVTGSHTKSPSHGVNLGTFFGHGRAVEDRPVFSQFQDLDFDLSHGETVHVALVKLADPQNLDDSSLLGIAQTLNQLARLSMIPCVVVDTRTTTPTVSLNGAKEIALQQADRLVEALEILRGPGARRVDGLLSVSEDSKACSVFSRKLLSRPLRRGRIPVIIPVAYTDNMQTALMVPADDAMLALTKELAGLNLRDPATDHPEEVAAISKGLQREVSVDRIILLDPIGGISTTGYRGKRHSFVNLEQEYTGIARELAHKDPYLSSPTSTTAQRTVPTSSEPEAGMHSMSILSHGDHKPSTKAAESQRREVIDPAVIHMNNLRLVKALLSLLPPSSSAIITTPEEAANSSQVSQQVENVSTVGTRRQQNPLIHNLLTDKPAQSSSLPPGRLGLSGDSAVPPVTSTFVKRGMPLTILPDPTVAPWTLNNSGRPRLTLQDPQIDLPRLVHLIEDSFDRKLDVDHYLRRVNDRIAGLIVAGEYEGGALLTWETPPGVAEDGSPEAVSRAVPYLDKFAVLKRSQGAGGVADIVFNAMVRGCLPDGVCWRSRGNNPVNKWYFERARGTWKIPSTNWTMFWTTPGVDLNRDLFWDYEGVCRSVQPSWADKKHIVD